MDHTNKKRRDELTKPPKRADWASDGVSGPSNSPLQAMAPNSAPRHRRSKSEASVIEPPRLSSTRRITIPDVDLLESDTITVHVRLDAEFMASLSMNRMNRVTAVREGGAADNAGLRAFDKLCAVDGEPLTSDIYYLSTSGEVSATWERPNAAMYTSIAAAESSPLPSRGMACKSIGASPPQATGAPSPPAGRCHARRASAPAAVRGLEGIHRELSSKAAGVQGKGEGKGEDGGGGGVRAALAALWERRRGGPKGSGRPPDEGAGAASRSAIATALLEGV